MIKKKKTNKYRLLDVTLISVYQNINFGVTNQ